MSFDKDEVQKSVKRPKEGWPRPTEIWKHYKGGLYVVLALAVNEASGQVLVIYSSHEKGHIWARSIQNWLEPVYQEAPGKPEDIIEVPRFVKV